MKTTKSNNWVLIILLFAIISLFLEHLPKQSFYIVLFVNILDFSILLIYGFEIYLGFKNVNSFSKNLKNNLTDVLAFTIFISLFSYIKYNTIVSKSIEYLPEYFVYLRNFFFFYKIFSRFKKLSNMIKSFLKNPAQTIIFSFFSIIIIGAILLMMPFAVTSSTTLDFTDALFTATSAVCVTGLIVVDTATKFTIYGQFIIMLLIQLGGLGIMIFTFFTAMIFNKDISLEDKLNLSYMLNEKDFQKISKSISKIIALTFIIEGIGAVLLYTKFSTIYGYTLKAVFFSIFHAISAFCNAGFALYSNSVENFKADLLFNFYISALIILGGISFVVSTNLLQNLKDYVKIKIFKIKQKKRALTLNTKIVLICSFILIFLGMLLIYGLEHSNTLLKYEIKTQYLTALFQSISLRTAGFNSIPLGSLKTSTYLLMVLLMFIGGAAGSTAGGIKVNNLGILFAYIRSMFTNSNSVSLMKKNISKDQVNKALLIFFISIFIVFIGTFIMVSIEDFKLIQIIFEVVSAFGTVGLSTGITPLLSFFGKYVIIWLMFLGRLGPLTIIAAATFKKDKNISYPEENILVG